MRTFLVSVYSIPRRLICAEWGTDTDATLAGLQDTNLARVRAAEDYLIKCNNIFIVTNISRAITDQSVKSSLYGVLSKHVPLAWEKEAGKGLKIAVVCTKSDEINVKAAKNAFCGPGKAINPVALQNLDAAIEVAERSGSQQYSLKTLKHRSVHPLIRNLEPWCMHLRLNTNNTRCIGRNYSS